MGAGNPTIQRRHAREARAEAVVVCRDLSKKFLLMDKGDAWRLLFAREPRGSRSFEALRAVSFTVPKGEFTGVLGRNGAGKSTLLRTVGGVFTRTGGFLSVGGHVSGLYGLGVGGHDLISGRDFADRWLDLNGEPRRGIPAKVEDIHAFSELGDFFDRKMHTYSTGMRARLYFAVVTAVDAPVYVIDEILTVGDEYFTAKCWRRLRERLAHGASGVFATHDWATMLKICTHAIVLEKGRVADSGPAPEVARRYLELDALEEGVAEFAPELPDEFRVRQGEAALLEFPVLALTDDPLVFGLSVEVFKPYYGWQHLLHRDPVPFGGKAGRWTVRVSLPRMNLTPGRYLLNFGMSRAKTNKCGAYRPCAARGWLRGNPLWLSVDGEPEESLSHLPMDWSLAQVA